MRSAIRVKNDAAELEKLRTWLRAFAEEHGLFESDIHAVELVLEELLLNVIAHGHDDGCEHFIAMRLSAVGADLQIEVEDDGRAFDPADAPLPDLDASVETRTVGGLGLHLVRSFVDELRYSRAGERNLLTLVKRGVIQRQAS